MMSRPPFSSSFAVKPPPAPPTMIGRPSASVPRSRACSSAAVYRTATVLPPRTCRDGQRHDVRPRPVTAFVPATREHLLEQLSHEVGEGRLVHVPIDEDDVHVRLPEIERLEQAGDERIRPRRPL